MVVLMGFLGCWQGGGAADPGIDNEESQEASGSIQKQADSQTSGINTHKHTFFMLCQDTGSVYLKHYL